MLLFDETNDFNEDELLEIWKIDELSRSQSDVDDSFRHQHFLSPTSASHCKTSHTGHFQIKTLVLYSNEILNLGSSNSYSVEYDCLAFYFAFYHFSCGWLKEFLFVVAPVLFVLQFFLWKISVDILGLNAFYYSVKKTSQFSTEFDYWTQRLWASEKKLSER